MYLGVEVREEAEDDGACVERVRHDEGGAGQRLDGCVGVRLGPRVDVRPELRHNGTCRHTHTQRRHWTCVIIADKVTATLSVLRQD